VQKPDEGDPKNGRGRGASQPLPEEKTWRPSTGAKDTHAELEIPASRVPETHKMQVLLTCLALALQVGTIVDDVIRLLTR
jgi:hypothetical protein